MANVLLTHQRVGCGRSGLVRLVCTCTFFLFPFTLVLWIVDGAQLMDEVQVANRQALMDWRRRHNIA